MSQQKLNNLNKKSNLIQITHQTSFLPTTASLNISINNQIADHNASKNSLIQRFQRYRKIVDNYK